MRISEFCEKFKMSHQVVYKKIKSHKTELDGHITKDKGNVLDLDPFAVNFLKPKRETYKALDERNYYLVKQNKELTNKNYEIGYDNQELNKRITRLLAVNDDLHKSNESYIEANVLLKQERDNLKSELSKEKAKFIESSQEWDDEKTKLNKEIRELKNRLQSAEEQLAEFTAKSQDKNAKNGVFKGLFVKKSATDENICN